MIKLIKYLLTPFLFILSWWHWGVGHVSYLIVEKIHNDGFWFHVFFELYQFNMGISGEMQEFVNGTNRFWPWEDTISSTITEGDK